MSSKTLDKKIKKLGIMGGSFNPIHNGHMNAAKAFIERLSLDELLLIPVNSPPHKSAREMVSAQDRFFMCDLAAKGEAKIKVSDIEIKRKGLSYTADTLKELKKLYPDTKLYLITGTDMFTTLDTWRNFNDISKLAVLCACARNDGELKKLYSYAEKLKTQYNSECIVEDIAAYEVSSTEVREKLERGENVSNLVDSGVFEYITQKGLYKNSGERSDLPMQGYYDSKIEGFKELLEKTLTPKRFYHTCCVSEEAVKLAKLYGGDVEKARFAGLVHDITKDNTKEQQLRIVEKYSIILDKVEAYSPKLLHAITGAAVLKYEHNIEDTDILNAVRYHTTARAGMSLLEKIIYLADYISADRDYEGVDKLRLKIYESMEKGMEEALDFSICEVVEKHAPVHIDTVKARNELILSK